MIRVIGLGGGEPEYKTPEHIIQAMKRAMDTGYTHYGDFRHITELREAIAKKYQRMGVDANPEWVIITPGSTMGIYMVYDALMNRGDEFLIMDPCFFGYFEAVKLLGLNTIPVPRYKEENWRFHVEDLDDKVTPNTKAILVCSPDNPTGAVMDEEELKAISDFAKENDLWIISDDIYDEITYDDHKFKSIAILPDTQERTIILNGLSKTYAMTGWRVGYIIAPNQEIYERLFSIQMATFLVVNAAIQQASVKALTGPQNSVKMMVAEYKKKRDYVIDAWMDIPRVSITKPQGAFYVFPDLSDYGYTSAKITKYIMDEAKVVVTSGHLFGNRGEGHIRNAYAQSMADLEEGLSRIRKALSKL